jgi:SP family sugar:H+ symporter-like MFS transporter
MYQFILGIGLVIGVCVDYDTDNITDTGSFRIPMAIQYVFPLILVPGLYFLIPESPRWLASKNKIAETEMALKKLYGQNADVQAEVEAITWAVQREGNVGEGSWAEIFKWGPEGRKAYLGSALQGK